MAGDIPGPRVHALRRRRVRRVRQLPRRLPLQAAQDRVHHQDLPPQRQERVRAPRWAVCARVDALCGLWSCVHLPPLAVCHRFPAAPSLTGSTGAVCMEIFGPWEPSKTMASMLAAVAALFTDANLESPIEAEAASLYKDNKYERRGACLAGTHACGLLCDGHASSCVLLVCAFVCVQGQVRRGCVGVDSTVRGVRRLVRPSCDSHPPHVTQ